MICSLPNLPLPGASDFGGGRWDAKRAMVSGCRQAPSPFVWGTRWMFPKIVGTPKSSILIGFSIINHPFWGTPIFGNLQMLIIDIIRFLIATDFLNVAQTICDVCFQEVGFPKEVEVLRSIPDWETFYLEYVRANRISAYLLGGSFLSLELVADFSQRCCNCKDPLC